MNVDVVSNFLKMSTCLIIVAGAGRGPAAFLRGQNKGKPSMLYKKHINQFMSIYKKCLYHRNVVGIRDLASTV